MSTNQRKVFGGNIDWLTVLMWFALCIIGWFNIHAAVYDPEHASIVSLETNYGKQFIFIVTAIILGTAILIIDSKFYSSSAPILYGITLLLLVAVLIVGRNVGGNQAWIPIGSFRLQPSEFAKLASCLMLARFLAANSNKNPSPKVLFYAALILLIPVALILKQPDTGSALAFFSLIFVFYREGYVSGRFMILGGLAIVLFVLSLLFSEWYIIAALAAIAGLAVWQTRRNRKAVTAIAVLFAGAAVYILSVDFAYNHLLQSHQRNRIDVMLGNIDDPRGEGYNLNQSMIAIGSGQLFGKGYLQGTQTKYNFVPEQSTDFIFCTIGEEWGFVGSMVIVLLYLALLLRIVNIAER